MKKIIRIIPAGALALFPTLIFAQNLGWFRTVTTAIADVVNALVPIMITLAFVVFVWGLITFILASGDEAAKDEGKRRMIWGVIALFIIISIWGIIALLQTMTGTAGGETAYPVWNTSNAGGGATQ